jgi:hypothetical protein
VVAKVLRALTRELHASRLPVATTDPAGHRAVEMVRQMEQAHATVPTGPPVHMLRVAHATVPLDLGFRPVSPMTGAEERGLPPVAKTTPLPTVDDPSAARRPFEPDLGAVLADPSVEDDSAELISTDQRFGTAPDEEQIEPARRTPRWMYGVASMLAVFTVGLLGLIVFVRPLTSAHATRGSAAETVPLETAPPKIQPAETVETAATQPVAAGAASSAATSASALATASPGTHVVSATSSASTQIRPARVPTTAAAAAAPSAPTSSAAPSEKPAKYDAFIIK